ncbi:MAG TPA: nitrilase-related carbon-nitrogen hydrolase [Candidatus Saccharimonadales bacterium]|nr:nitrilase-related carbon-nitrogen hydrolase [Candidatus Saccharimonadales bacterium]
MKKQKTKFQLRAADGAAIISAVLFYLGFGLHPLPFLTWFILLPLLVVAPRISARRTAVLSVIAGVLGQIGVAIYFAGTLQMPPALLVTLIAYLAAVMAGAVLLGRLFFVRRQPLLAVLAVASAWVAGEYLLTILAPHGAWWSLGYSQSSVLPLLQIVSITGVWGLSFLLTAFPAALAGMALPDATFRSRIKIGVAIVGVAAVVGIFGAARLHQTNVSPKLRLATAVAAEPSDEVEIGTPAGKDVLAGYQKYMQRLAAQHVHAVVFSEKGLRADQKQLADITAPLAATSRQYDITAVVGVMVQTAPETYENRAIVITPNQGETTYVKQHLIPGLEGDFDKGDKLAFVPGTNDTQGVIICKDLDFQAFARSYRQAGASVLLAPAWDFNNDGWLHSRIAITRGVEDGMAIVRTGRDGQLTISDAQGRVLAEHAARENIASDIVADVPNETPPTLYTKVGDWLAYVSIAFTLGSVGYLLKSYASAAQGRTTRRQ